MNTIVIELCAEDRARIDRLTEAMERKSCDSCVKDAMSCAEQIARGKDTNTKEENEPKLDEVQQKLAEVMANANANAPASAPIEPSADEHPVEEPTPWEEPQPTYTPDPEAVPTPAPVKAPSLEEFQKALILKCAESADMKLKARTLLQEYAPSASQVPEDKRAEVLERLAKL